MDRDRHTDPALELGPRRGLTGQLVAGGPGGQRGQGVGEGPQPGRQALVGLGAGEQRGQRRVPGFGRVLAAQPPQVRHVTLRTAAADHSVTPVSAKISASRRNPRWAATLTAPALRPVSRATASLSSPATTRSMITSACMAGSLATSAITDRVARCSIATSAASSDTGSWSGATSPNGATGRRERRRRSSIARRRAVVNNQARHSGSSPRKATRPRTTCTQVSAATSSAASGTITRRYRSNAGLPSRHNCENASPLPPCAAPSTTSNPSPITAPEYRQPPPPPQQFGHLHTSTTG